MDFIIPIVGLTIMVTAVITTYLSWNLGHAGILEELAYEKNKFIMNESKILTHRIEQVNKLQKELDKRNLEYLKMSDKVVDSNMVVTKLSCKYDRVFRLEGVVQEHYHGCIRCSYLQGQGLLK